MKESSRILVSDTDRYLFGKGQLFRAYRTFGCHRCAQEDDQRGKAYSFTVWAPHARGVSLVGDFNQWDESATPMVREKSGIYTCVVHGLEPGSNYKYCIAHTDGSRELKADPFAFHAEHGLATASKVWELDGYEWHDQDFVQRREQANILSQPMSVYEVNLGSWRIPQGSEFPSYREIAPQLASYCTEMGYTHVELMPLTEFPLPASWGYQVTGYFSVTSRYGTPQDFMYLVDTLHQAGIGVILDWVPAHFPRDAWALARFDGSPLFEYADPRVGEHPEWGTLVFDYGKPQVVSFLVSSAMFFFDVYHIDGMRVDAVSSMLYLDYGRTDFVPNKDGGNINLEAVEFLRTFNHTVLTSYPGALTIAEESTAFPLVTYPPDDGGLGFVLKWDMGFMHDTLQYASIDPLFRSGNHRLLTFSMMYSFSENYMLPFSHDEVVHGKKSMVEKMHGSYEQRFSTLRAVMGLQFGHPGKKLTFMGSEFAQVIEWDYAKQLDWMLLDYPMHEAMQRFSADLNKCYLNYPALWRIERDWDGFSWANANDYMESAIAFLRMSDNADDPDVLCCCNFTPNALHGFTVGLPCEGMLEQVLNSDDVAYGGQGKISNALPIPAVHIPFEDKPFSARIDLPPLSCVYFTFERGAVYVQESMERGDSMSEHKDCVAMILAGGQGSRLGVLTRMRAKPAVPYGGKYRIIDFPLSNCANSGIDVVGVLTQYEPTILNGYIGTGAPWDLDTNEGGVFVLQPYTHQGDLGSWFAGTADAIWQNRYFIERYDPAYLVVLSGDHIYKMDYSDMLRFHKQHNADVTIAVMPVPIEEASRFGILSTDDNDRVTEFAEKPEQPKSNLASMGIYVFTWNVVRKSLEVDANDPQSSHDFGKNVIPGMLRNGRNLYAYRFEGYWRDVGTVDSLWEANMDLLDENSPLQLGSDGWTIYSRTPNMPAALVGQGAHLDTSMVSEGCEIEGTVRKSVLFQGVHVCQSAVVDDSVVMSGVRVGPGAVVRRAVIAENVDIGPGAVIGGDGDLVVLGQGSRIAQSAVVEPGTMVEPYASFDPDAPDASQEV